MKHSAARTAGLWLAAVAWTVALAAGLWGLDRWLTGEPEPPGWVEAEGLAAVPAEAGPILEPSFLPSHLAWPPSRVVWRKLGGRGVWLGVGERAGGIALWIGAWTGEPPAALGPIAGCLATPPACPEGWRALAADTDDRAVRVLTTLAAPEARTILEGLVPRRL